MRSALFGSALAIGLFAGRAALAQYEQAPGSSQYGQPAGQPPAGQAPIQSGGLAPPASTPTESPEAVQTEAALDDSEKKDSGRGLEWVWLNAELGFEHLGLQTFKASTLTPPGVVGTTQTGLLYGAGLGVRLVFITLGARFRIGTFSDYDVWTLNAEAGLRIPIGRLEPYLTLGGGFASLGAFSASSLGGLNSGNVSVTGYDIRAGGGLDYYVTPVFSVGAALTFEMLGLTRPGVNPSNLQAGAMGSAQGASAQIYRADGTSLGSALTGSLVLGLHF